MVTIPAVTLNTVKQVFSAHLGQAEPVQGYGVTPWRQWLITNVGGHWYSVTKADPTGKPKAHLCSLAQAKANLLAGY